MLQIKAKKDAEQKERLRKEKEKQDRLNRDPNVRMLPMRIVTKRRLTPNP